MASEREHASLDFARKESAIWEAKACELQAHVDALTADRDALAGIVERVRKMSGMWSDLGSYPTSYSEAVADINRALTPTREGA
jgi:hypothetical protein